jgi:hypothetical protein
VEVETQDIQDKTSFEVLTRHIQHHDKDVTALGMRELRIL